MKKPKHIHKLRRHRYPNGTTVYFCILNCSFKIDPALALGKEVLCNRCDNPFFLDKYALKRSQPYCHDCKKTKEIIGETPDLLDIDRRVEERRQEERRAIREAAQSGSELADRMKSFRGGYAETTEDDVL